MARNYGKVRARFWTGETGKAIRALGLEAQVVASYLLTCGSSNMIGLYYLPLSLVSHETGIPIEGASKALRSLGGVGFAHYDESEEVVFVPRMAAEQIAEQLSAGDKQCAGVVSSLQEYRKSLFFQPFVNLYKTAFHLPFEVAVTSPIEGPCKALRSQEQEQEQEQSSLSLGSGSPPVLSASGPDQTRAHVERLPHIANEPGKPSAALVLAKLGALRAEIVGGSKLFWQPGQRAVEKVAAWLSETPASAVPDIEPAMRLACEKIKAGADGWTGAKMADPDMLVGALVSKWSALREELHGCAPAARAGPAPKLRGVGSVDENWR